MIRAATVAELDLIVRVDLEDEGVTPGYQDGWGPVEFDRHRAMILGFILDEDKCALVTDVGGQAVAVILGLSRSVLTDELPSWSGLRYIVPSELPADGIVLEVFQLWVHADYRRQGLGTALKLALEDFAHSRGIRMIYTHTEECNAHVIELNDKLGYREIRRGPLWDEVARVSLVKDL